MEVVTNSNSAFCLCPLWLCCFLAQLRLASAGPSPHQWAVVTPHTPLDRDLRGACMMRCHPAHACHAFNVVASLWWRCVDPNTAVSSTPLSLLSLPPPLYVLRPQRRLCRIENPPWTNCLIMHSGVRVRFTGMVAHSFSDLALPPLCSRALVWALPAPTHPTPPHMLISNVLPTVCPNLLCGPGLC
jgi:hypothetical protein